ncbi:hypothetical protein O3G_MSEX004268 [Manduca sexta]|uniref:Serum response factor-binding protein 1 n=2 Tax=Manduca sexta TaxID=7130 RepID=A0A921YVC6_MANSE|nr:hypothetical protein O3G_MSEX004268 [Manduca sexta]
MEVGAVKQAFNNELILLKKNLNQARTQVIHKLTRKAKTLTEKKAPDTLKEKLKRKAESAINEVLILKKIKVKDLAQFMITHQGELKDYLNRPNVDHNKACARLLLHKALQEKYKHIRGRFAKVPIRDLFMSRQERLKLKKEAKEKQKSKQRGKNGKVVNAEGDWDVEDIKMSDKKVMMDGDNDIETEKMFSDEGNDFEMDDDSDNEQSRGKALLGDADSADEQGSQESDERHQDSEEDEVGDGNDSDSCDDNNEDKKSSLGNFVKLKPELSKNIQVKDNNTDLDSKNIVKRNKVPLPVKKSEKKKDVNKNKNLNEKLLQRKFKKGEDEAPVAQNKVVDPFFITSTGENYMSVAEPRQPDEVKEIHKQGNRKLRRAAMFGHVPKIKPKENYDDSRFRQNDDRGNFRSKFNDKEDKKFNNKGNFNDRKFDNNRNFNSKKDEPEKLHPSWEAKKKKSGILPFEGKKIVFDES